MSEMSVCAPRPAELLVSLTMINFQPKPGSDPCLPALRPMMLMSFKARSTRFSIPLRRTTTRFISKTFTQSSGPPDRYGNEAARATPSSVLLSDDGDK